MRLIDAEALAEHKFVGVADWPPTEAISWQREWNDAIDTIIEAQPTVEVVLDFHAQTPRHGHWVEGNNFHWYSNSCSCCGYTRTTDIKSNGWNQWKYCPMCGAKMDEVGEDD